MSWAVHTGDWQVQDLGPVDHLIVDPPYSEHVHSKSRAGARKTPLKDGNGRMSRAAISREVDFGFECLSDEERKELLAFGVQCCKRWFLSFSDVESAHMWRTPGLEYIRTCAWIKIGGTPQFTGDRPAAGFETITVLHPKGRKRWNAGGKLGVYPFLTVIERGGQRRQNNTRMHPTQKPLDLMLALVSDFTDPGDTVLDPYCGSGTTGVACLRLGRHFIGCERNPKWAAIARERLAAETEQSSLTARQAGQQPLFGGNDAA